MVDAGGLHGSAELFQRFKAINDTLGHPAGDAALKETAGRLSRLLQRSDVVARLAGDEFIVMIQNAYPKHSVAKVAERLIAAIGRPHLPGERQYWTGASIGVSTFPQDGGDPETLIRNADTAMYRAKMNGRNNYQFFNEPMHTAATRRLALERNLRAALERRELQLCYQPEVDIDTKGIRAAEALLRGDRYHKRVHPRPTI